MRLLYDVQMKRLSALKRDIIATFYIQDETHNHFLNNHTNTNIRPKEMLLQLICI